MLDLGLHGANVFAFTDFKAPSADVEGAIMAGRDVQLSSYSVNANNVDAFGQLFADRWPRPEIHQRLDQERRHFCRRQNQL